MGKYENTLKVLELGNLEPGNSVKVVIKNGKYAKTGESAFGVWYMWFGEVENTDVAEGRKPNQTIINNYSGEVAFFTNETFGKNLLNIINGNDNVPVLISRKSKKTVKGFITYLEVEPLEPSSESESNGEQRSAIEQEFDNLIPEEKELVNDVIDLIANGAKVSEDVMVIASQEIQYKNKITKDRARELYKKFVQ